MCADLALQSNTVLLLDHGTDMFIWEGLDVAVVPEAHDAALAGAQQLAAQLAAGRFPAPHVRVFKEASSMARFMSARLIPMHHDATELQDEAFPKLRALPPAVREHLRSKLAVTDAPSYWEWMARRKCRPPARDVSGLMAAMSVSAPPQVTMGR